ncbi:MAG: hypothetical protein M5U16_17475 [Hyphomicrobium sp.]|nr:hypothetical protein [Hyphomicrobium sp.]
MRHIASFFACVCTVVALLSPTARAACPEGEDLDIQLRDKEVQRQLILSGFLAAEIGRANEKMLRTSIADFRAANSLPGTDEAILTEAECDTLKHNNNAVYAFVGFKQVINPVNQLKMTFPAGLLPPEAKPSTETWQEYENPKVSRVGIDVFRVSGRGSSTNSFSRGYQSYGALTLTYLHNSGSEVIAEGAGNRWGSRYFFHNMNFEYQGGQRGIYIRFDMRPPEGFVPPPEILPRRAIREDQEADRQALHGRHQRRADTERERDRLVADRARRVQHRRLRFLRPERLAGAHDQELRIRVATARAARRRAHRVRHHARGRQQRRRHEHHVRQHRKRQNHLWLRAGEPALLGGARYHVSWRLARRRTRGQLAH